MKQSVVALVGISGVGKSTLLNAASDRVQFQHLQASALIKEAREAITRGSIAADDLRQADINDNQTLLIHGFDKARSADMPLIVLDGHTVIDTPSGLVRIEPQVFAALGVTQFILLTDDAHAISSRRNNDQYRKRPKRSPQELDDHQTQALLNAFTAARELNVPLTVFTNTQLDGICAALKFISSPK
jgi:adenylate kinase